MSISTPGVQTIGPSDRAAGAPPAEEPGATTLDRLMAAPDALARYGANGRHHQVEAGETLSGIAREHGTTWQTLARINGIANPDRITVGQQIRLPETNARTHVVRGGETLSGIAAANGTSVAALARANGIANPDRIATGQTLQLPGRGVPASERPAAPPQTPAAAQTTNRTAPAAPSATNRTTPATGPAATAPVTGATTPGAASVRAADLADARAAGRHSSGSCYAYVKVALQRGGAVPDYLPGVPAKGAGPALEQRGFVNILGRPGSTIRSPYDAPKGAVLVYGAASGATDRNAKYGHIEIRTDHGFASDYVSANARTGPAANGLTGRGRELIGVYVKPDTAAQTTASNRQEAPQGLPGPSGSGLDSNHRRLAQILGMGEGNYESYNTGTRGVAGGRVGHSYLDPAAGTVTNKTINEVLGTAGLPGTDTHRMFAVGAYQIIQPTLRSAVTAMHLTGDERLTPELQDRIFSEYLVPTAGNGALGTYMRTGAGTVDQAQAAAARQWASIAVPAGMRTQTGAVSDGTMTFYGGPANRANVEATQALRTFLQSLHQ